ncbi:unnamed protein product [Soboliphyme baturini]|uniref:Secreted protein n=1 Tax=Soboliphyme baturini TaxID=241478 RepID=A0A183IPC7_9BILA|nr:unnamed protein product [Soboliphyme baturini]
MHPTCAAARTMLRLTVSFKFLLTALSMFSAEVVTQYHTGRGCHRAPCGYFTFPMFVFQVLCLLLPSTMGMSMNYVNATSTQRPTFVINFDIATITCQRSKNQSDLIMLPISALCDGKRDCWENEAVDDEKFPYCSKNYLRAFVMV